MSIVIKGLSKPHSCYGCFIVHEQTMEVGYCPLLKREVRNFKECPKDCPIEEVKEAKRASWIKDESKRRGDGEIYDYCCSLCQGGAVEGTYGNLDVLTDYCPHCGAEMEKRIKIEPFEMSDPIYLLSKEEYEKYKEEMPTIPHQWWLRAPCYYFYAYVIRDSSVSHCGYCVNDSRVAVRPALNLKYLEENLEIHGFADKFIWGGATWIKVDADIAVAEMPIFFSRFDKKSNDYAKSEVRQKLLGWFEQRKRCKEIVGVKQ